MKFVLTLIILLSYSIKENPFVEYAKQLPQGWSHTVNGNNLVIQKDSTIDIQYCDYSQLHNEPIVPLKYQITVLKKEKLSENEVMKRKQNQDAILQALEQEYEKSKSKFNYGKLVTFKFKKNKIDSLRLPFYSDNQNSYFFDDNLPWGHCIVEDSIHSEIESVRFKLLTW